MLSTYLVIKFTANENLMSELEELLGRDKMDVINAPPTYVEEAGYLIKIGNNEVEFYQKVDYAKINRIGL